MKAYLTPQEVKDLANEIFTTWSKFDREISLAELIKSKGIVERSRAFQRLLDAVLKLEEQEKAET